ncbi:MAG: AMP-dependent synthetase and ligase [Frankiales bacterium]|nr:AMP-dependent synthetase and ligase [Frankiales bacterium]
MATGATAVVGSAEDCDAAFVLAGREDEAAGADDVLALSGHPLGAPCGSLPPMVQDYAREVPSYGDHFGGPRPGPARWEPAPGPLPTLGAGDRLLTVLGPEDPGGLAALLGALTAGAGLVLCTGEVDLAGVAAAERVTATAGTSLDGLPQIE